MTREEARHWLEIELKTWEDECKSKHPIKEALSVAIKALEQEPKIGHWIMTELPARDAHECSECGGLALVGEYGNEQLTDFCPHCGADMSEVEE